MGRVLRRVWPAIVLFWMACPIFLSTPCLAVGADYVPSAAVLAGKEFIRGGTAEGVFVPSGGWKPEGDVFVGQGRDKIVLADHLIGEGNFDIEVKLTMHKVGSNYAAIQIGNGRVVLGGDGSQLIFRGLPKNDHRVEIGPLSKFVEKDKPFQVRIRRRNDKVFLFMNGKRVHVESGIGGSLGEIGIIAGDGPVDVHFFRANGNLSSTGRKLRINREALKTLERDERLTRSIEGGIDFILDQAQANPAGVIDSHLEAIPGARALEAYALIVAGIDTLHPVVRSHLEACAVAMPKQRRIYDVSCWVFALDAAISQAEQDALLIEPELDDSQLLRVARKHRKNLEVAAKIILDAQNSTGGWRYLHSATDADLSVTQFASLAVGVFARRDLPIPEDCWEGMINYALSVQMVDGEEATPSIVLEPERESQDSADSRGGTKVLEEILNEPRPLSAAEMQTAKKRPYHYADKNPKSGSWNMSCAGVSSLLIAYHFGKETISAELRQKVRASLRDGVAWIESEWQPHHNFYGMYSLEKVGDLGEIRSFGEHEWYLEMSNYLLDRQQNEGSWGPGENHYHGESDRLNTSFALLILKRASALLTRGPRDVVIFTGGGQSGADDDSDDWVVLPRTGNGIHLPSLVRQLRLRPHPKLLGLLEEAIESLPPWKRPTVVPYLALVRERAISRGVRKVLERCEEQVRPRGFSDSDEMEGWYRTWRRAREIGEDQLPEAADELINIARAAAADPVLRETALRAALQLGIQKSARLMVEDLSSEHRDLRVLGYQGIRSLFPDSPPEFDPDGQDSERVAQIQAIQGWVESRL